MYPHVALQLNSESSRGDNLLYLEWARVLFLKAQLLPFSILKCRLPKRRRKILQASASQHG